MTNRVEQIYEAVRKGEPTAVYGWNGLPESYQNMLRLIADEARRLAIEECAKVAEANLVKPWGEYDAWEAGMTIDELKKLALFSCSIDGCREEVSYHQDMLAVHPKTGKPICEGCWDEEDWDFDVADERPHWGDLEPYTPIDDVFIAAPSHGAEINTSSIGV